MKTPTTYPVPLRAKRGQFSFLRDIIGGGYEAEQMARFRDFLAFAIAVQKRIERGPAGGAPPPVADAEVQRAIVAYRSRGISAEVLALLLPTVAEWKLSRLRRRASAGGRAKAAKASPPSPAAPAATRKKAGKKRTEPLTRAKPAETRFSRRKASRSAV